jgi:arylsulfatase A-like enzyme
VGGYVREGIKPKGDTTDNAPLRGGKGMLYEGGVRIPYIFRWPGQIAAGTCDRPLISVDMYPTFLQLAKSPAPKGYVLDGVSLVSCLKSGGREAPRRDALYWHFPGYLGAGAKSWRTTPAGTIRMGDWKLHEFFEDGTRELYNLKEDIGEKTNLAAKMPDKVKELHAKLVAWRESVKAPMPTANKEK